MAYTNYVKDGLTFGLIGAGIGSIIGLAKAYKDNQPVTSTNNIISLNKYENIVLDSVAVEALSRFQTYQTLMPLEYETILYNLNKLIGIQVSINNGKIEPYFPYRATQYTTNIQTALNASKAKVRNTSVPHFEVDSQSILSIAEDYVYNISRDVDSHLLSRRTIS
jgi:hypothetical protein